MYTLNMVWVMQLLSGTCYTFLRATDVKPITVDNITHEVNFMFVDCSGGKLLKGLEFMLAKIFGQGLRGLEARLLCSFFFFGGRCLSFIL